MQLRNNRLTASALLPYTFSVSFWPVSLSRNNQNPELDLSNLCCATEAASAASKNCLRFPEVVYSKAILCKRIRCLTQIWHWTTLSSVVISTRNSVIPGILSNWATVGPPPPSYTNSCKVNLPNFPNWAAAAFLLSPYKAAKFYSQGLCARRS